jgi:XTP/dITP diphosphohydrolase
MISKTNPLLLATRNTGKVKELCNLVTPGAFLNVHTLTEYDVPPIDETGATFEENACLKAIHARDHTGLPTLADDSGLCVNALGGRPGVKTARYGNFSSIIEELEGVAPPLRTACFECVLAFAEPGRPIKTFKAHVNGSIVETMPEFSPYGFGFDSLFIPEGAHKTYGEMTPEEKQKTSPRPLCFNAFTQWLFSSQK